MKSWILTISGTKLLLLTVSVFFILFAEGCFKEVDQLMETPSEKPPRRLFRHRIIGSNNHQLIDLDAPNTVEKLIAECQGGGAQGGWAAYALGIIKAKESRSALINLGKDENIFARYSAAESLDLLGEKEESLKILREIIAGQLIVYKKPEDKRYENGKYLGHPTYAVRASILLAQMQPEEAKGNLIDFYELIETSNRPNDKSNIQNVLSAIDFLRDAKPFFDVEAEILKHRELNYSVPKERGNAIRKRYYDELMEIPADELPRRFIGFHNDQLIDLDDPNTVKNLVAECEAGGAPGGWAAYVLGLLKAKGSKSALIQLGMDDNIFARYSAARSLYSLGEKEESLKILREIIAGQLQIYKEFGDGRPRYENSIYLGQPYYVIMSSRLLAKIHPEEAKRNLIIFYRSIKTSEDPNNKHSIQNILSAIYSLRDVNPPFPEVEEDLIIRRPIS